MRDEFYKNGLAQDLNDIEDLSDDQRAALNLIKNWWFHQSKSEKPYVVIGGCSGSGKSTLIRYLQDELNLYATDIVYCAFTGKAALVLNRKGLPARTIHSTIYECHKEIKDGKIEFTYTKIHYLYAKLVVVDQASMVSEQVFKDLLSYHVPVIFVGDHQQLPPVNSKFNLMTQTDYRMSTILRQLQGNPIINLSVRAIKGEKIPFEQFAPGIRKVHYDDLKDEDLLQAGQILVGTNAKKKLINETYRELCGYGEFPQTDEKLIATANNMRLPNLLNKGECVQVYNGQIVYLLRDARPKKDYFEIEFMDELERLDPIHGALFSPKKIKCIIGKETDKVNSIRNGFGYFEFGYAISVHRSQGSSWKDVMVLDDKFGIWESRETYNRWLYTAITRAEETLTIVSKS